MEMLLVVLLLTYAEKDGEFKKQLMKALAFYRENRELLHALGGEKGGGENEDRGQKNSPPEGGENLHILEEFLKKI